MSRESRKPRGALESLGGAGRALRSLSPSRGREARRATKRHSRGGERKVEGGGGGEAVKDLAWVGLMK
eukprot:251128-Alexandrium_andersonii.AAC.1